MISSALADSPAGTSRRSAVAVFRLITNSNFWSAAHQDVQLLPGGASGLLNARQLSWKFALPDAAIA